MGWDGFCQGPGPKALKNRGPQNEKRKREKGKSPGGRGQPHSSILLTSFLWAFHPYVPVHLGKSVKKRVNN